MKSKIIITAAAFLALFCGCTQPGAEVKEFAKPEPEKPKNIIFLVGDGMGLSQVSSLLFYGNKQANLLTFPHVGLIKTSSSKEKITDSAAGATAFSTGQKSYNGAIAVNDEKKPIPTIIEQLNETDFTTVLISTSSITHATPASYYAHVESRKEAYKIAAQMVDADVDFFAGGGKKYFRESEKNNGLFARAQLNGLQLDSVALPTTDLPPNGRYGFLLAEDGLPKITEGRGAFLQESFAVAKQYARAKNKPFFMMIEGSQIDWGGHANDAEYLIEETRDFDNLIGDVLAFAKADANTLVVVTADHETGGFTLSAGTKKVEGIKKTDYNTIAPSFSTGGHSATMVPVFAFGPGAEKFGGVYENTAIYHKMMALVTP